MMMHMTCGIAARWMRWVFPLFLREPGRGSDTERRWLFPGTLGRGDRFRVPDSAGGRENVIPMENRRNFAKVFPSKEYRKDVSRKRRIRIE